MNADPGKPALAGDSLLVLLAARAGAVVIGEFQAQDIIVITLRRQSEPTNPNAFTESVLKSLPTPDERSSLVEAYRLRFSPRPSNKEIHLAAGVDHSDFYSWRACSRYLEANCVVNEKLMALFASGVHPRDYKRPV